MNELRKKRNSLDALPVKIHNTMARTLARFEEPEYAKLFLISMACLLKSDDNIAHINKVELFDKLNITDEQRHTRYFKMLNEMRKRTEYDITIDDDTQIAGNIIYRIERTRSEYQIAFDDKMAPILKELKGQYAWYYIDAVMNLNSSFSISLYNYLISWVDKNVVVNKRWLSTQQLKELFGLDKDAYMRKDGTFGRTMFEKQTIQKAIDEIVAAKYMNVRWYKAKDKLTGKVIAYVFEYVVYGGTDKAESGIEYTQMKYGKQADIIIRDESELDVPAEQPIESDQLPGQMSIDDIELPF